jgi:hypothetical protein
LTTRAKRTCFLIGPIGKDKSPDRNHADMFLEQIVRPSLSVAPFYFNVQRADHDQHSEDITNMIFFRILEADILIADLTYLNPNVFYELAFAHTVHKRVIHCAAIGTELPFDIRMLRVLNIDTTTSQGIETTKRNIQQVARAMISENYVVRNPIISVLERQPGSTNGSSSNDHEVKNIIETIRRRTGPKSDKQIASEAKDVFYMLEELKQYGYEVKTRKRQKKR